MHKEMVNGTQRMTKTKPKFAQARDRNKVMELLDECGLPCEDLSPAKVKQFLVLRDRGKIVAALGMETVKSLSMIRSIAVRAEYRGKGYGTRLMEEAEQVARGRKKEALFIFTTMVDSYFAKYGFHRIDRRAVPAAMLEAAEVRNLCPPGVTCMVKLLLFL